MIGLCSHIATSKQLLSINSSRLQDLSRGNRFHAAAQCNLDKLFLRINRGSVHGAATNDIDVKKSRGPRLRGDSTTLRQVLPFVQLFW